MVENSEAEDAYKQQLSNSTSNYISQSQCSINCGLLGEEINLVVVCDLHF